MNLRQKSPQRKQFLSNDTVFYMAWNKLSGHISLVSWSKYFSLHFDQNLDFKEIKMAKFEPKFTKKTPRKNEDVTFSQSLLFYIAWNSLYGIVWLDKNQVVIISLPRIFRYREICARKSTLVSWWKVTFFVLSGGHFGDFLIIFFSIFLALNSGNPVNWKSTLFSSDQTFKTVNFISNHTDKGIMTIITFPFSMGVILVTFRLKFKKFANKIRVCI